MAKEEIPRGDERWTADSNFALQSRFVSEVCTCSPEVLWDLAINVGPSFEALPAGLKNDRSCRLDDTNLRIASVLHPLDVVLTIGRSPELPSLKRYAEAKTVPDARALIEKLDTWSVRFNIGTDWIKDIALQTLWHLDRQHWPPRSRRKEEATNPWNLVVLRDGAESPLKESEIKFDPPLRSFEGWQMQKETWAGFEDRAKRKFEEWLRDYRADIEDSLRERGWQLPPEVRCTDHFKWLVYYQTRDWTPNRIARKFTRDPSLTEENKIFKGVKKAAQLIDLPLRTSRKNRSARKT